MTKQNEKNRQVCKAALDGLMARCEDVTAAMLALRDGRPYVENIRGQVEPGKLAAMSSSLLALGQTVLRELASGTLDHVLVEGADGKLVVANIPGSGGLLIISVLARRDARLGLVLGHTKMCSLEVSSSISTP